MLALVGGRAVIRLAIDVVELFRIDQLHVGAGGDCRAHRFGRAARLRGRSR